MTWGGWVGCNGRGHAATHLAWDGEDDAILPLLAANFAAQTRRPIIPGLGRLDLYRHGYGTLVHADSAL